MKQNKRLSKIELDGHEEKRIRMKKESTARVDLQEFLVLDEKTKIKEPLSSKPKKKGKSSKVNKKKFG